MQKHRNCKRVSHAKKSFSQAKLISVNKGKILDVFVDFRKRSRTYLRYGEIILSSINRKSVFLPKGFAHGYMTLDANTEISYKINNLISLIMN